MPATIPPTSPALGSPATARDHSSDQKFTLLIVVTLAAFLPLFTADFTNWDDSLMLTGNPRFNPPTVAGALHYWPKPVDGLYIPITYTTWAVLAKVAHVEQRDEAGVSLNPWVFHGFNVFLHVMAAVVAYRILLLLIHRPWVACAGALLFALHPVQVEPVGWVAGMKDVLAGLFLLLALWQYLRFASADAEHPGSGKKYFIALATIAFIVAMLSKPSAMVLPAIAAWLDYWLLRRPIKRIAIVVVPWLALSTICAVIARLAQTIHTNPYIPLWARPLLATDSMAFYLYKLIWPAHLCVNYDRRAIEMIHRPIIFYSWIVPIAIALTLCFFHRRARPYIAAAGVFVLGVLPVLNLAAYQFQDYAITADHYLYVSMFGAAIALAFVLAKLPPHRAIFAITAAMLLALGARSFMQSRTWQNSETLFRHTLAINPRSGAAHDNLAAYLIQRGQVNEAIEHCYQGMKLRPEDSTPHTNLAIAFDLTGRQPEAAREYLEAIRLNPWSPNAYASLAAMLASIGRFDESIRFYQQALKNDPDFNVARTGIAHAIEAKRKIEGGAIEQPRAPKSEP